jgi:hypothetical protein
LSSKWEIDQEHKAVNLLSHLPVSVEFVSSLPGFETLMGRRLPCPTVGRAGTVIGVLPIAGMMKSSFQLANSCSS